MLNEFHTGLWIVLISILTIFVFSLERVSFSGLQVVACAVSGFAMGVISGGFIYTQTNLID
jgi:hypothetical protein